MEPADTLDVAISPTLATLAKRFNINLSAIVEEALTQRILNEPVHALTARMRTALLAAQAAGQQIGHKHVGTEHVFLAILQDAHSIPSQILEEIGVRERVAKQIETILTSETYNRHVEPEGGARSAPG